jgi:hypothetical protein
MIILKSLGIQQIKVDALQKILALAETSCFLGLENLLLLIHQEL